MLDVAKHFESIHNQFAIRSFSYLIRTYVGNSRWINVLLTRNAYVFISPAIRSYIYEEGTIAHLRSIRRIQYVFVSFCSVSASII
jgi:hypothetical protein